MRKAIALVAIVLGFISLVLAGSANATTTDTGQSQVDTMTDGCVQTQISRLPSDRRAITYISVTNVCSFNLNDVTGHVFNSSAGLDQRDNWRRTLVPNQGIPFDYRDSPLYTPYGSLTCGELWTYSYLHGRDCVTT